MSLGLGIFLSVITLVIVWQLDKRKAWKRFAQVIGGLLLLVLLAFGVYIGWHKWEAHKAKVAVREGKVDVYGGIRLGAAERDLIYSRGEPTEKFTEPHERKWVYLGATDGTDWGFFFDDKGKVTQIECAGDTYSDCEAIAGISTGSTEAELVNTLGNPESGSGALADGQKFFAYGTTNEKLNVTFVLRLGKVAEIHVNRDQYLDPQFLNGIKAGPAPAKPAP